MAAERRKFTVRMIPATHDALKAFANDHRYSVNTVLEALVQLLIEADETECRSVLDRAEQVRRGEASI